MTALTPQGCILSKEHTQIAITIQVVVQDPLRRQIYSGLSPAIESRLGERRSGMPGSRLISGDACLSPHRIEVFSKEYMRMAFTVRIYSIARDPGPLPT
jgi:hypothetical protein